MHIEHLYGGEFIDYATRAQAARVGTQLLRQRDVQAVGEERDEDVRDRVLIVCVYAIGLVISSPEWARFD